MASISHASQTSPIFEILPVEVIIKVLGFMDLVSILKSSETCVFFRDLIKFSKAVEYLVELERHGYVDIPCPYYPPAEKIKLFRDHELAWRELKYRRCDTYPISHSAPLWDLFGGVWAQGISETGTHPRTFQFTELPSVIRGTEGRSWEFDDVGVDVRDFRMIPQRDFLALIETNTPNPPDPSAPHRVHLRSLSTNLQHPEASGDGILSHIPTITSRGRFWSFVIEIQDDILGLLCEPRRFHGMGENYAGELVIWNWVTGQKLNVLSSTPEHRLSSFLFLGSNRVLVCSSYSTTGTSLQLEVYRFRDSPLVKEDEPTPAPYLAVAFDMPKLNRSSIVTEATIRGDPPVSDAAPSEGLPFHLQHTAHTYVLSFQIARPPDVAFMAHGSQDFTMFLRLPVLLEWYYRSLSQPSLLHVPWKDWGPDNTRLFRARVNTSSWVCYIYGDKFVIVSSHGRVSILDFNPESVRRGPAYSEADSWGEDEAEILPEPNAVEPARSWVFQDSTSVDVSPTVFEEEIRTSLPYRMTTTGWCVDEDSEAMIDNEHILLISKASDMT